MQIRYINSIIAFAVSPASLRIASSGKTVLSNNTTVSIPAPSINAVMPKNIAQRAIDFFTFAPATANTVPANPRATQTPKSPKA